MIVQKKPQTGQQHVYRLLQTAFLKEPDSAGILQGVRKMRKGRPHIKTHLFPSPKNGGYFIACEGSLEYEMALALELHPLVTRFRGQPINIPGMKGRDVVPDFAVDFGDGFGVIDNKPSGALRSLNVKLRMAYIRSLLGQEFIPHYIFSERHLSKEPFRQIRRALKKGLGTDLTSYQREQILCHFEESTLSVGELRKRLIAQGFKPHTVEAAAAKCLLTFTIDTLWSERTQLGVNHGNNRITATNWGTVYDICPSL